MLQLLGNNEETSEVYDEIKKTITIKEGIKPACLLHDANFSPRALPLLFPPILFPLRSRIFDLLLLKTSDLNLK